MPRVVLSARQGGESAPAAVSLAAHLSLTYLCGRVEPAVLLRGRRVFVFSRDFAPRFAVRILRFVAFRFVPFLSSTLRASSSLAPPLRRLPDP